MTTPIVSVLVTAYNRENYIAEAIESILASTFTNFELIIVDDCSVDNTVAIARKYEATDDRVKVYINEKNLGDYPNRNKAAGYAKGKYIKYLDSDDLLLSHGLMEMVRAIESFEGAAMAMMWVYDDSVNVPVIYTPEKCYREYFINNRWLMVGPSGCIYDAKIFFKLGGFSGKNYVGDFEYNLKCTARYPIVKMQNNLIFYRVHEQQQTFETGHAQTYKIWLYKIQQEALMSKLCPLNKIDKSEALKKTIRLQARRVVFNMFKKLDFIESYKMIVKSKLGWANFFKGLVSFK